METNSRSDYTINEKTEKPLKILNWKTGFFFFSLKDPA